MAGRVLDDNDKEKIYASAEKYGIGRSQLRFRDEAARHQDVMSESEVIKDIYAHSEMQLQTLRDTIDSLHAELGRIRSKVLPSERIFSELQVQYPGIEKLTLTRGTSVSAGANSTENNIVAIIESSGRLDDETVSRITKWLKVRLEEESVDVMISLKTDSE